MASKERDEPNTSEYARKQLYFDGIMIVCVCVLVAYQNGKPHQHMSSNELWNAFASVYLF